MYCSTKYIVKYSKSITMDKLLLKQSPYGGRGFGAGAGRTIKSRQDDRKQMDEIKCTLLYGDEKPLTWSLVCVSCGGLSAGSD